MRTFFSSLITCVEDQLKFVHTQNGCKVKQAEEARKIMGVAYARLEKFELDYTFCSPEEEINYFKVLKPELCSKLIYFWTVHRIETEKPDGSPKLQKDYLQNELDKISGYFKENVSFICYYEARESYRDHLYFRRNTPAKRTPKASSGKLAKANQAGYYFEVASILANDLLQTYLRGQLRCLNETERPEGVSPHSPPKLIWTESKAALVELIYSIQRTQALNHGEVEIKDLADSFEKLFHIDLGNYYRAYLAMRARKTGRTKFLDSLRSNLIQSMDEQA